MNFTNSSNETPEQFSYLDVNELKIRLIYEDSLWSHILFNASKVCGQLIDSTLDVKNKTVLELGSGCGYVAIECLKHGAKRVVANDYPDKMIRENLVFNILTNFPSFLLVNEVIKSEYQEIELDMHWWGTIKPPRERFDIVLMCDVTQVIQAQSSLVLELEQTLSACGTCYLFYQHHQPAKRAQVEGFFSFLTKFQVQYFEKVFVGPQFPEDHHLGDLDLRSYVNIAQIRWKDQESQ